MKQALPFDEDAEAAVLGAILSRPESLSEVATIVRAADFSTEERRAVFEAAVEVDERGDPPDVVHVVAALRARGLEVSPLAVREMAVTVPVPAAAASYARRVAEVAGRRRVIRLLSSAAERAASEGATAAAIAAEVDRGLSEVVAERAVEAVGIEALVSDAIDALEARDGFEGLGTGFRDLDRLLGGLFPSNLIVVAARPGVGKSAFVLNVARRVALDGGRVLVFSLEMSRFELTMRLLCSEAAVSWDRVRADAATGVDYQQLLQAAERLVGLPLQIVDDAALRLPELRAIARRARPDLVVVDYLQLMPGAGLGRNRQEEVAEISRGLKLLAKELGAPVIAVSQLNRDPERRQDKRPQLSDLRESGSIEQDADVVVLLHRDGSEPSRAEAIVAKHRNGPTDKVDLTFILHLTTFRDAARY